MGCETDCRRYVGVKTELEHSKYESEMGRYVHFCANAIKRALLLPTLSPRNVVLFEFLRFRCNLHFDFRILELSPTN
jgi:hypothetical protein